MRIGAIIPNDGELPGRLGIAAMARAAEDAGAESLWVSDHVLMVDGPTSRYPYSADGRQTWSNDVDYFEALTCCATMAAATRACRIGTAVLVLPQRGVLEVAKIAATIDRLSGGRLQLGVGAGWNEAEMRALGYDFQTRGARFDEMLDVLRDCWTGRPRAFAGDHVQVPDGVVLHPRPLQAAGPPLLIGGMSDAALRRAARRGAGWLALAEAGSFDVDALRERLGVLGELRGAADGFTTLLKLHAAPGEAGELPRLVHAAAELGFDETIVEAPWEHGIDAARATIAAVRAVSA